MIQKYIHVVKNFVIIVLIHILKHIKYIKHILIYEKEK